MRRWLLFPSALGIVLAGCGAVLPVVDHATRPVSRKSHFADVQKGYSADIRYGLYDDALAVVEPELQGEFRAARAKLAEVRFSDFYVQSVEMDPMRTNAVATVVYRGYWLSSPFEREVTVTQRWRRKAASHQWYVTPDLTALVGGPIPAGRR